MKKIITSLAAVFIAFGFVSCASSSGSHTGHAAASGGVKAYTKNTCIVTDNKLGSMGDPISMVHNGQEVKFCCKPCVAKFKANPDKFLAKL